MDKKWWTLIAVCTGTFMLLLDVTIVVVASLPSRPGCTRSFQRRAVDPGRVRADARIAAADLGALADRYGRKRLFAIG